MGQSSSVAAVYRSPVAAVSREGECGNSTTGSDSDFEGLQGPGPPERVSDDLDHSPGAARGLWILSSTSATGTR